MPNPYFQFKAFTIRHDRCAMKVCTDACILGAWFASKIEPGWKVLDIGAGSGLLTLMLAQKTMAQYNAIERDENSYRQMKDNFAQSKWDDRVHAFWGDAVHFSYPHRYDFIICNPPFYENDLKSDNQKKNLAKHDTGLTLDLLLQVIDQNLDNKGSFGVLLPYHRTREFIQLAQGLHLTLCESVFIRQSPRHHFFRSILHFSRNDVAQPIRQELTIRAAEGQYSTAFAALMKDYYLQL